MGLIPFDIPIDRRASDSVKWGKYAGRDVLPLWVADMDFAAPPAVIAAIQERLAHPVLGYGQPPASLAEAVISYLERHYDWRIDASWLVWLPGLVTGLNVACRTVEGAVQTATPVYPPFLSAPRFSGRALQAIELDFNGERWTLDPARLAAATTSETHLYLLCHPHNPVGRCWSRDELTAIAAHARANDLVVCSDEIHCGLILDKNKRHLPFAALSEDAAQRTITLMAPSKTFNIPGLGCAFAVIANPALRRRFLRAMDGIVPHVNVLGFAACEAAYRDCDDWQAELLTTLRRNRERVAAVVNAEKRLKSASVEATYLAWIDVRGLNLADPSAHFEAHGLGLSDGRDFGAPGWLRLNFGCPEATLVEALRRFNQACKHA